MIFDDFLKTKKMRNVRTVILAAVSRQDLYYVSENESFCFGQKNLVQGRAGGPQVLWIRGPEKNREQKVGPHMDPFQFKFHDF